MPQSPLDPEGLRRLARAYLQVSPDYTSKRTGGRVSPASVPDDVRRKLEAARTAYLTRIADSPDYARELNEAVQREDLDALRSLSRQAAADDEVEITITGVDSDFWMVVSGCWLFFCWSISFGW